MSGSFTPTPGPWGADKNSPYVKALNGFVVAEVRLPKGKGKDFDEGWHFFLSNRQLIIEAGTVANETGLTPRQLADQRAELLIAAKMLADLYHGKGEGRSFPTQEQCDFARAVIAKCTGAA